MSEETDQAFERARHALQHDGGVVTVILGNKAESPTDWTWHPRVHWIVASQLKRIDVPGAVPSNTKLMFFTDDINVAVFQPLHNERKRRRLPYMIRKDGSAVAAELARIFPNKVVSPPDAVFSPALPAIDAASTNGANGSASAADAKRVTAEKGSVTAFLKQHADLTPKHSTAEEARRLFPLARAAGLPSTLASIEQAVRIMKRKAGFGSRPESVTPVHVTDTVAVSKALEQAIELLTAVKLRVESLDKDGDTIRSENEDLRTRIQLMK